MKLNEKTTVPLFWFVSSMIFASAGAWGTAMAWFGVKSEIQILKIDVKAIAKKLDIEIEDPDQQADLNLPIDNAYAGPERKGHHAHTK